jgi:hypothetical protein
VLFDEGGRHAVLELLRLDGDVEVGEVEEARVADALQHVARFLHAIAAVQQLVAVEAHAHRHAFARRLAAGLQRLDQQPHAVVEPAAVFVGAAVEVGREELLDHAAVRGVDLDAVEPRRPEVGRGLAKAFAHAADLRLRHRMGGGGHAAEAVLRGRRAQHRRGRTHRLPVAVRAPPVPELGEDLAAGRMHRLGQRPERRNAGGGVGAGLVVPPAVMNRAAQDHQPAAAIPHPLDGVGHQVVGGRGPDRQRHAVR